MPAAGHEYFKKFAKLSTRRDATRLATWAASTAVGDGVGGRAEDTHNE